MLGKNKTLKRRIIENFGKNPLEGITFYDGTNRLKYVKRLHDSLKNIYNTDKWIDEITWEDLEMNDVFLRINHTNSFIGEQILYHKLHDLDNDEEKNNPIKDENIRNFFKNDPEQRINIETKLCKIGKAEDAYYLQEFIQNSELWKVGNTIALHILQLLLAAFLTFSVISDKLIFIGVAVVIAGINLTIYTMMKKKYEMYLNSLAVFKQVYDFSDWMIRHYGKNTQLISQEVRDASIALKKISGAISNINQVKQYSLSGDACGILNEYIRGIALLDVSTFNHIMKIIADKQDEVMVLLEFVGNIDCNIAILSYRESIDNWCLPEFVDRGICTEGIVHPLLTSAIDNNFYLEKGAIITGANASGKSTFMKAIAINSILAQTINTCTADSFKMKKIYVMTCMSLRDDILSGESYYFREAKYIKRMLDADQRGEPVLLVIDEILRGTNTRERIATSKAILDYFERGNSLVLVATHDNELAENSLFKKYYFESHIDSVDVIFNYRICEGICQESNAIALLSVLNYPDEIIRNAKENLK